MTAIYKIWLKQDFLSIISNTVFHNNFNSIDDKLKNCLELYKTKISDLINFVMKNDLVVVKCLSTCSVTCDTTTE